MQQLVEIDRDHRAAQLKTYRNRKNAIAPTQLRTIALSERHTDLL